MSERSERHNPGPRPPAPGPEGGAAAFLEARK